MISYYILKPESHQAQECDREAERETRMVPFKMWCLLWSLKMQMGNQGDRQGTLQDNNLAETLIWESSGGGHY